MEPKIEIIDEPTTSYGRAYRNKKKQSNTQIPMLRGVECSDCGMKVKRENGKIVPHNRKVFRRMLNGLPDWKLEACPGGNI